ncbi:MAG: hypothetical protein Q9227_003227 [Pyrenula ochraceoflavens]
MATIGGAPLRNGLPPKDAENAGVPSPTLYCTNLNDKLNKNDLRRALYMIFSTYGPVLDVVAVKNRKMRGQAHIVFRDVQASTQAMRSLQGFDFFGKDMKITYAKGQSHVFARLRGTFEAPTTAPTGASEATDLQRSIFNAPPSSNLPKPPQLQPPNGQVPESAPSPSVAGVKRPREDESDEEEAPMDEDDEGDAPMEASSDED